MKHHVLVFAAALACAALTEAAEAQTITLRYGQIANSARSPSSLPLYVGQRKGFFAKEGIDLKVVGLKGVRYQIEELDKGNVDVSYTALPYLIEAVLKGSDSVAIVGASANNVYTLIAQPEIKSYADLKGKTIGLSLPVDTISIATRLLLAKHDVKDTDYKVKEVVSTRLRGQCLAKKECDAVPMGQPADIVLAQKGYTSLGNSLEVIPVLQFSVVAVRRAWAQAHKDAIMRFVRASGEAYKFMRDKAHRDEVVKIMVDTLHAPENVARAMLALYYEPDRGVMPKQGEISIAGVNEVIALLGQSGKLKAPLPPAEKFIDLQYLQAAGLQ
jgi:ABC-type nitrate/sulfonate/bicarbonate transport system substrate-binding protein